MYRKFQTRKETGQKLNDSPQPVN